MRHDPRRGLVIALDGASLEGNTRGKDDAVVRQLRPTFEAHVLGHRIDRRHGVMDDVDAVSLRKCLIAMREGFQRAKPGEIEVAEEAGRVPRFGLDQCYIECFGAEGQVLGGGRTANAAADHNDPRLGLASRGLRTRAPLCTSLRPSNQIGDVSNMSSPLGFLSLVPRNSAPGSRSLRC